MTRTELVALVQAIMNAEGTEAELDAMIQSKRVDTNRLHVLNRHDPVYDNP